MMKKSKWKNIKRIACSDPLLGVVINGCFLMVASTCVFLIEETLFRLAYHWSWIVKQDIEISAWIFKLTWLENLAWAILGMFFWIGDAQKRWFNSVNMFIGFLTIQASGLPLALLSSSCPINQVLFCFEYLFSCTVLIWAVFLIVDLISDSPVLRRVREKCLHRIKCM